jgi:hypothetical protein
MMYNATSALPTSIGGCAFAGERRGFEGWIDDVRLFDNGVTSQQVRLLYYGLDINDNSMLVLLLLLLFVVETFHNLNRC